MGFILELAPNCFLNFYPFSAIDIPENEEGVFTFEIADNNITCFQAK
jgi:hypothetical protein